MLKIMQSAHPLMSFNDHDNKCMAVAGEMLRWSTVKVLAL